VGVSLEVTPRVSPDGRIKLKIKPEVSSLLGYASTREGVNEGPITSTRSAETEVQIKDGQTVVIGGLIKDESLLTIKKIPILGDIPLLGLLFTRKEVGPTASPTERTDLLIFVTARIIKETTEPLLAYETGLTTSPRPFKLEERKLK
jgi:type II secretory pathway component GspD/PulD (secretin)